MSTAPLLFLNDGNRIPQLGLGTWQVLDRQVSETLGTAFNAGYRSIDTAAIYNNETAIGEALCRCSIPREQIFITTKVWNSDQGFDNTLKAFDKSLARLGLDYADLYLIHWPAPALGRYVDTWRALIRLRQEGRVRSIGVSNFNIAHLQHLIDETGVTPAINQIELHPQFAQTELRAFHAGHGIRTESSSPLAQGGAVLKSAVPARIARKHGRTPAQIILRWHIELGLAATPKATTPEHIHENAGIFDFKLDPADIAALGTLDTGRRLGPNPDTFSPSVS
ncbi:MAG: aldo/keto reductase [Puniceicoccales bacterium]|jgi:diketogulonate reductase-like aldo/keto reductase|nr:aldo/keto reductase [Puniceicoccales bacterium]